MQVAENEKEINVESVILKMRRSRMGIIQTASQLQFCWKTIAFALKGRHGKEKYNVSKSILGAPGQLDCSFLQRSSGNQMTSGLQAKSLSNLSIRKRSSIDSDSERERKLARRYGNAYNLKQFFSE